MTSNDIEKTKLIIIKKKQ